MALGFTHSIGVIKPDWTTDKVPEHRGIFFFPSDNRLELFLGAAGLEEGRFAFRRVLAV
jgi:hypothetical protein